MIDKFDLVIPMAIKDLLLVKKNVYFIKKFIQPSRIFIISNSKCFKLFSKTYLQRNSITLIDENEMIHGLSFVKIKNIMDKHFEASNRCYGWYFQQILKMGAAEIKEINQYYLIWDADTIPTSDLNFFGVNNKIFYSSSTEYHKPYFNAINKLLVVDKYADFSFITEHMLIVTSVMQKLISEISNNTTVNGDTWFEKIINASDTDVLQGFSEFETYGTYILNHYEDLYVHRKLNSNRNAGMLYGRYISKRKIKSTFVGKYDVISLEQWQTPKFPYCILDISFKYVFKILTKLLR